MNQQNTTQLLYSPSHFSALLSPTPRGARLARLLAVEWMRDHEVPYGVAETGTHVVAELAANAATHGRAAGRSFRLALLAPGDVLRIEVTDTRARTFPASNTPPPTGTPDAGCCSSRRWRTGGV